MTLSADGVVNVGYLGTEPDLNGNVTPMVNEVETPEQVLAELEDVEEQLQKILENREGDCCVLYENMLNFYMLYKF